MFLLNNCFEADPERIGHYVCIPFHTNAPTTILNELVI